MLYSMGHQSMVKRRVQCQPPVLVAVQQLQVRCKGILEHRFWTEA